MPLLASTLQSALQALVDAPFLDEAEAIEAHAAAFRTYMEGLVNPPALPAAHDEAEAAFILAAPGQSLSLTVIQDAYVAYVTTLAPLTVPYDSVPPAGPPPLALVDLTVYVTSIDLWVRTGTASLPPLPPDPWA